MNADLPAVVAMALISGVITLMLFRFVRPRDYLRCRPPLFIGGVVFMPLFVAIAVVLQADWDLTSKAAALMVLMVGFWASATWLTSARTQGRWVPGLEFGPGLNFRPDLILPGGVTLVKGVILSGIGIMLAVQETFRLPQWNWWGFVLAFFGILTLIPIRGMAKMLARRGRFLGRPPVWSVLLRWGLLVVGLSALVYGFLAAFMGMTPLTEFRPVAGQAPLAGVLLGAASLSLLGREIWKRRLPEGPESSPLRFGSNLWLYGSVLVFMYGSVLVFMGRIVRPHPVDNPAGLTLGAVLLAMGAFLVLVARSRTQRHELRGMIRIMVGTLAAIPPEQRRELMERRLRTLAGAPVEQRAWHMARMIEAVAELGPEDGTAVEATRNEVVMTMGSEERRRMMEAMDRLVAV